MDVVTYPNTYYLIHHTEHCTHTNWINWYANLFNQFLAMFSIHRLNAVKLIAV